MAVVQALQGETPSSLQAEEARLSACKGDLAAVDGSFDLVLAYLKKILWSGKMEAVRPRAWTRRWVKGGFRFQMTITVTISLWPCMAMFMFWDRPLVALNRRCIAAFYEWIFSLRFFVRFGWCRRKIMSCHLISFSNVECYIRGPFRELSTKS
ncbi:hypothetical protein F2Q69_00006779 [Brassica cretica]|uniref:Uncharacterized protein n=1 Tax=Brassica cretica TaxID=69181 RepID=A0A8S9NY66_BRACR|nr:hypothetical protein F2Q69_00006779 [Brassica cretica]